MNVKPLRIFAGIAIASLLFAIACGGGSSSSTASNHVSPGSVHVIVNDDPTQDWATVGVKVLSVALVPQGGGAPVAVYTAPAPAPTINLLQLDQLGEIIGNASVPAGTYTSAQLTISANPGDVVLVSSADPDPGFDLGPGYTVQPANIRIQGATGSAGGLTVPLTINLQQPLTVAANTTNALDLEFDLAHPAFIVEHYPASASTPIWAINFNGPVRHHVVADLTRLILRHTLGQVTAVSSDNSTITITKDYATYPVPASGTETPIPGNISLNIQADSVNGTILYNADASPVTHTTIDNFSSVASTLAGKYVRIAARYQAGGTLVAVRIWYSSNFQNVWVSPEGHVVHVNNTTNVMSVTNENGIPVRVAITGNTQFFFRTPQNALADATPIGTGTAFFDGSLNGLPNLPRGFKVHVGVTDPLASTLTADTVDIEIARFDGAISAANTANFTYNRDFATAADDYTGTLPYIATAAANGTDANGNAITGFDWWYFTLPTLADTSLKTVNGPVPDFVTAVNAATGVLPVDGLSYSLWGDGATNLSDWYARDTIVVPTALPKGIVTAAGSWVTTPNGGSIVITPKNESAVTVELSTVSGSATLVYEVKNQSGVVTVTQEDLTTAAGLAAAKAALVTGTQVKAYAVPTATNTVAAYVLFYYDGNTLPQ
jgi:hypothetical protein